MQITIVCIDLKPKILSPCEAAANPALTPRH